MKLLRKCPKCSKPIFEQKRCCGNLPKKVFTCECGKKALRDLEREKEKQAIEGVK